MNTSRKLLAGVMHPRSGGRGCSAASHIGALQPPKIKSSKAPFVPHVVDVRRPRFQLGLGIDLYGYKNENYGIAAAAEVSYFSTCTPTRS